MTHKQRTKELFFPHVYKAALHFTGRFSLNPSMRPYIQGSYYHYSVLQMKLIHIDESVSITNQKALELRLESRSV